MELNPLSVLYHPHFEPDLATLRRALLVNEAVRSIVPTNANFTPSVAMYKHMATLPDTFIPTPPEQDDVNIAADYYVLQGVRAAFAQLSKDDRVQKLRARFSRSKETWEESLAIGGATYLSAEKLTHSVYAALHDSGLIFAETDDGDFLVDERAANLVVSYLAQRMSHRLSVRTLASTEESYLLSTACDVYDAFEPDKNALFASSILRLHLPDDIGEMDFQSYSELRARYESLRESFPIYLEQIRQLYGVSNAKTAEEVLNVLRLIEGKVTSDMEGIKKSKFGANVRKWTSFGISSALTVSAAVFPDNALTLSLGAIGFQAIGLNADSPRMTGHFDGVRSMLLSANEEVLRATRLPGFFGQDFLKYTAV